MKKTIRTAVTAATAVVAGIVISLGAAGAASAEEPIIGQGSVTLDFGSTPGSVEVGVWTKNLSTVPAWGTALVKDVDGTVYPFGPRKYSAGEEWTYSQTLDGYTCADLGNATAFAFGFRAEDDETASWESGLIKYPDPRVTVIGCPAVTPTDGGVPGGGDPGVTPTDGGTTTPTTTVTTPTATTPTATNTLPAAKTDGADLAGRSTSSPLFGMLFTLGAVVAASAGAVIAGARRRR